MPHFNEITETHLRAMARDATAQYLENGVDPTAAVIKVASAFPEALTSEHVRRVCEMTYHDIYERSFRTASGPDRVVNFDPPDAVKVASAIRARQLKSFSDKLASAPAGGAAMNKTASAIPPTHIAPAMRNAFLGSMASFQTDTVGMRKEARFQLLTLREELREAARALEVQLHTAASSEKVAFVELSDNAIRLSRQGVAPEQVVAACVEFAKSADIPDHTLSGIATDLLRDLMRKGLEFGDKLASFDEFDLNLRHPIRAQAIKVAELRGFRIHGEIALRDLRAQAQHVEQELLDVRYQ